jgi:hypothetical protein
MFLFDLSFYSLEFGCEFIKIFYFLGFELFVSFYFGRVFAVVERYDLEDELFINGGS